MIIVLQSLIELLQRFSGLGSSVMSILFSLLCPRFDLWSVIYSGILPHINNSFRSISEHRSKIYLW